MTSFPLSREVLTTYGPVIGRRLINEGGKQVDAFQGIPYATPPVGDLRFKKPVPPEPWNEVKECKKFGPRSIQKDFIPGMEALLGPISEDSLTLNVFNPVWKPSEENGFPVIVFIHGGAFVQDSVVPYGDVNICKYIVAKDVVVVTLQYRLGLLGFWSTGDEHCPGNNALWDATLALKWVKENISRFNGDSENITLLGHSAGGVMADMLSLSPHSRDLFKKIICMAGVSNMDWGLSKKSVETCRNALEGYGISSDLDSKKMLEELRKLPATTLASSLSLAAEDLPLETLLGPVLDGDFFPKPLPELRKEAPAKPRIVGVCKSEGLLYMMRGKQEREHIAKTAAILFPKEEIHREYANQIPIEEEDEESIQRAIAEAHGDRYMNIGTQECALECVECGKEPVFMYRFDHFNPEMYGLFGAKFPFKDSTHVADISFLFGKSIFCPLEFTENDLKVINEFGSRFTNFAKFGDPNGVEMEKWLPATNENPQRHLQLGLDSKMSEIFFEGRPLWCAHRRKERKKE